MRRVVSHAGLVIPALVAIALLGFVSTTSAAAGLIALTAATALIMGGSGHPLSTPPDTVSYVEQYVAGAISNYIAPASTATPATGIPGGPYNGVAVITPEQFAPNTGTLTFDQSVAEGVVALDDCIKATGCPYNTGIGSVAPAAGDAFVVFGFSQSTTIETIEKRDLAAEYPAGTGPQASFVLVANGNRPNGGFLARGPQGLTYGGGTFSGPTPTDTQYPTVDIAAQYDGWSDFPLNPLDLLADINALDGINYLHMAEEYSELNLDDPSIINQGSYGDTTYYLAATPILPLLMPLEQIPAIGYALADSWDPALRVLVEAGYNRNMSPGQPAPWNLLYFPNPLKLAVDFIIALPTGADNGFQDLFGIRPFGTQRPGPYGVGGPSVESGTSPATAPSSTATAVSVAGISAAASVRATAPRAQRATAAAAVASSPGTPSTTAGAAAVSSSATPNATLEPRTSPPASRVSSRSSAESSDSKKSVTSGRPQRQ